MTDKRVFLIVMDSFGIGALPDAARFNDVGSNTLRTILTSDQFHAPTLQKLGLFNIEGVQALPKEVAPLGAYARMTEASNGKDTTIGHWEIAGIISTEPLPTYPQGFPAEIIEQLEAETGRKILCNRPYSGTEVIRDYGQQQVETGALIVYTSADSVCQIAAHEEIIPVEELYRICEIARGILVGEHAVGRVIARPFTGSSPEDFKRTANRHDFSLKPPRQTMLDVLCAHNIETYGIGKINDIFAGQGIRHSERILNNTDGMEKTIQMLERKFTGLCFVNLVDFDMLYGHRNDIDGYAAAVTAFDAQLEVFISRMRPDDLLMITADHGCDPGFSGSDHTREYTPLLVYGQNIAPGVSLGTRATFADIGASVLEYFAVENLTDGTGFLQSVTKDAHE
ncbi:MAG: phosphopentomutase [Lachnospiraceae bacterium]